MAVNPQVVTVQHYQGDGSLWALLNNGSWYKVSSIPPHPLVASSTYPWITSPNSGLNNPQGQA
jgi:hypothetical protein